VRFVVSKYVLSTLRSCGADINARNFSGNIPITVAARYANVEVARVLLEHGAYLDDLDMYLDQMHWCRNRTSS